MVRGRDAAPQPASRPEPASPVAPAPVPTDFTPVVAYWSLLVAAVVTISWLAPRHVIVLAAGYVAAIALLGAALNPGRAHLSGSVMFACLAGLVTLELSGLPLDGTVWGMVGVAVSLSVFALLPIGRMTGFPLLHVYCLLQAVYLAVGVFIARPPLVYDYLYSTPVRVRGFMLSVLFMVFLVATGVVVTRWAGDPAGERPEDDVGEHLQSRALLVLVGGTIVALVVARLSLDSRLGAIAELLRLVPVLGALVLIDLWLRKMLPFRLKVLLVASGIGYALAGIGTGLLYRAAGPFIAVLILVIVRRRRVPWAILVAALAAVLVLNAGKVEFRKQYNSLNPAQGISQGPEFLEATARAMGEFDRDSLAETAHRFSTTDLLGYIHQVVPSRYPYWDKRTYIALPLAVVPRVLVPFKPKLGASNEFGREYGLIEQSDNVTSVNIPLPVEAYVNFGLPGLMGVGIIAGAFLGLVGRLLRMRQTSEVILGALIATQALSAVESGALGFVLVVPFLFLLRPVARWLVPPPNEEPATTVAASAAATA